MDYDTFQPLFPSWHKPLLAKGSWVVRAITYVDTPIQKWNHERHLLSRHWYRTRAGFHLDFNQQQGHFYFTLIFEIYAIEKWFYLLRKYLCQSRNETMEDIFWAVPIWDRNKAETGTVDSPALARDPKQKSQRQIMHIWGAQNQSNIGR